MDTFLTYNSILDTVTQLDRLLSYVSVCTVNKLLLGTDRFFLCSQLSFSVCDFVWYARSWRCAWWKARLLMAGTGTRDWPMGQWPREGRSIRCWTDHSGGCKLACWITAHVGSILERLASNFMSIPSPAMVELPSTRTLSRARAETFVALVWGRDIFGTSLGHLTSWTFVSSCWRAKGTAWHRHDRSARAFSHRCRRIALARPTWHKLWYTKKNKNKMNKMNKNVQEILGKYSRNYKNEPSFWDSEVDKLCWLDSRIKSHFHPTIFRLA